MTMTENIGIGGAEWVARLDALGGWPSQVELEHVLRAPGADAEQTEDYWYATAVTAVMGLPFGNAEGVEVAIHAVEKEQASEPDPLKRAALDGILTVLRERAVVHARTGMTVEKSLSQ